MSSLAKLQAAKTILDVAALLGFKASRLAYVLYSKDAPAKFRTFQVPKKSGGARTIEAPNAMLKTLQRRLADLLQDCEQEIRVKYGRHDGGPAPDVVSHGFVRGRSIVTNAEQHRRRRMVFNVDLEEFFPSINFGRVRGFFIRDRNFALHPSVATILAQVACSGNHLPQGSPCSPVIANLIGHILDVHLVKLAGRTGCRYTRYADDLTFSTNKKAFPSTIAVKLEGNGHEWTIGSELSHLVTLCGFRINKKKTRMQYRDSRQEVTGLVVNRKVNVPSGYRHTVRAMVHHLFMTGAFEIVKAVAKEAEVTFTKQGGKIEQLHGMLGFIDSVDLHNRNLNPNENARVLSSKELTYRRFLLFQDFYVAPKPVLVCEGKTDSVYLTHAIRSMATRFTRLASVDASKKVSLNIRRYRYENRSAGRVLGIGGGHGDLQRLLFTYRDAVKRFKAPGLASAIIVLIDNDSAARPMLSAIKQITGIEPDPKAAFIRVLGNLYVVLTPLLPGGKTSVIEDFFDVATRAIKVKGKAFDPSNKYSSASHYGKADFAYQVVQPNADTIDFTGFSQLLENVSLAIEAHEKRLAP